MYTVAAHVMSKRVDSMNMITIDLPVAPMQKYIREHKADAHPITHMGLIVAAYLRTVAEFPALVLAERVAADAACGNGVLDYFRHLTRHTRADASEFGTAHFGDGLKVGEADFVFVYRVHFLDPFFLTLPLGVQPFASPFPQERQYYSIFFVSL